MRKTLPANVRLPRPIALAACLAAALGAGSAMASPRHLPAPPGTAPANLAGILPAYVRLKAARAEAADPYHPSTGTDHPVTSCADDGASGTLRSVIADPNTVSGDSINLTMLPMTCSTITLGTTPAIKGPIHVAQYELHIHGPGAGSLTIDGNFDSNVFYHSGGGTLSISDVTIANGYYIASAHPTGGCISSQGNVLLIGSVVTDCTIRNSNQGFSLGGGAYAQGYLTLFDTVISGSHAYTQVTGTPAAGGGALVKGDFTSAYSVVSGNTATQIIGVSAWGVGGGIFAEGNAYVISSTISENSAGYVAGLDLVGVAGTLGTIINSTISENIATSWIGGIYSDVQLTIANSTVAFNAVRAGTGYGTGYGAGVYLYATNLKLQSSIIAANRAPNGPDDLGGSNATFTGSHNNLITSWDPTLDVPMDTLTSCPQLDPLADNGGATRTHKLRHMSPAIEHGDPGTLLFDQRGAPRVYPDNGLADIGAVEWQPTDQDERILGNGFDGVCDW
jgi:hypothetical protein